MSGHATEGQLFEALRRYKDRTAYVQKTLFHLFQITQSDPEPVEPLIKVCFVLENIKL